MEEASTFPAVGRSPVMTRKGVVCTASPLSAGVGLRVLQEGGNAFDAVVAAALTEAVVIPPMCGLGGDAFALFYHASSGRCYALMGSGRSPASLRREDLARQGFGSAPPSEGPLAATVPGFLHACATLLERFGTRPFSLLVEPAIGYAEEGFVIPPGLARYFRLHAERLRRWPTASRLFLKRDGSPYSAGEVLVQRDLVRTLRHLARYGPHDFYTGALAREVASAVQEAGGALSEEDLASHRTVLTDDPPATEYRGYTVYETDLPSQGVIVLEMLNILEGFDLRGAGHNTADYVHLLVEAKKLAFADRLRYLGDPQAVPEAGEWARRLRGKEWAEGRRARLDPGRAMEPEGLPPGERSTTFLCAVDAWGNAVAFIHSIYWAFGSLFVPGDTGVLLNNRMNGFFMQEGHPNGYAPGKRPVHTLNCYLVLQKGRPYLVGGTPGADFQPQWNVQVITRLLDLGLGVQEAVEAPHFVHLPGTNAANLSTPSQVWLEPPLMGDPALVAELERRGHRLAPYPAEGFRSAKQVIRIDPATGVRSAGSDPRCDGQAVAH